MRQVRIVFVQSRPYKTTVNRRVVVASFTLWSDIRNHPPTDGDSRNFTILTDTVLTTIPFWFCSVHVPVWKNVYDLST